MREVLFRGKRKDNGEWVVGGTIIKFNNEGDGDLFFMPQINEKCIATHDDNNNIIMFENCTFYEIIPETVEQYTGLTDKNGKKIFEGDIVKYEGYVYQCKWNEYNYEYVFDDGEGDFGIGYTSPYELEIIGNIHDNRLEDFKDEK
jgi:uncharacterized phage protein (TIGR01671 family)